MARKDKQVFHVGDTFTIAVPDIVYKVGYDYDFNAAMKEVINQYGDEVRSLMGAVLGRSYDNKKTYDKVVNALAYGLLRSRRYTSTTRQLYTTHKPELHGRDFIVSAKQVVYTGTYTPGYSRSYPEYDAEPPTLTDSKAHVLLHFYADSDTLQHPSDVMIIDSSNVILKQS